ncbi:MULTISPECIES: toll/interleukin-1 receptor domain-containing protein [unclassified Lactococcus]|uniref:toll/interleukin-1 receptor domain-containing protein n=1 Tax=unclassified Lactococcus TaxID=2643510 RepID=UPI0011CC9035|nr:MULTISPECIES: toll/interleukin-1 receptor domain-containing protein [unclassified Lactococcus]MQW23784.1 TIR domain-containing protein [Lactococcus sp. dk101]TXK37423.1 toll/interleukin-1 receptor domain-containing protein [Lactococcus sp. dk310]TXK48766.1 toll/interleukin-1 receptor domain-containing protein [Lactococcus sp. dk322]
MNNLTKVQEKVLFYLCGCYKRNLAMIDEQNNGDPRFLPDVENVTEVFKASHSFIEIKQAMMALAGRDKGYLRPFFADDTLHMVVITDKAIIWYEELNDIEEFTTIELSLFDRLFNKSGYVLDFSNASFDSFTKNSIGIGIQELYQLSKGKSLGEFWRDPRFTRETKLKLLKEMLEYYEFLYEEGDTKNKQFLAIKRNFFESQTEQSNESQFEYDVFISYTHTDSAYVDDLIAILKKEGINFWRDKEIMSWGDSIRRKIDDGLVNSRFGIVILSSEYLNKYWTNNELDGLFALESGGGKRILPIWHNISIDEIKSKSPIIASRLAKNSSQDNLEEIVASLKLMLKTIKEKESNEF